MNEWIVHLHMTYWNSSYDWVKLLILYNEWNRSRNNELCWAGLRLLMTYLRREKVNWESLKMRNSRHTIIFLAQQQQYHYYQSISWRMKMMSFVCHNLGRSIHMQWWWWWWCFNCNHTISHLNIYFNCPETKKKLKWILWCNGVTRYKRRHNSLWNNVVTNCKIARRNKTIYL